MSPYALILLGLGIITIIIGVKGSQHDVVKAFKGVRTT
jgi:hypothetical protein